MKKIAIISPLARVVIDGKSIRSLEAIYLKKHLENTQNAIVHYVSKKIKETNDYVNIFELQDLNDYDEVYIHNFNTNFFGGTVPKLTNAYMKLLSSYQGKVWYYITDPKLTYKNVAKEILKRKSTKFEEEITVEQLKKYADDISFVELRMNALFTGYNYQPIYGLDFYNVTKHNVFHDIALDMKDNESVDLFAEPIKKEFDICYYGDNRGTHRNNKIKKYFNNSRLSTMTIGCDLDLQNNTVHDKVEHSKLKSVVQRSYSSLVIGDKEHENAFITMRFYENLKFEVVSFIDIDYDPNKTLFKSQTLKDFNYIASEAELCGKLATIKSDENFYQQIINQQKLEL